MSDDFLLKQDWVSRVTKSDDAEVSVVGGDVVTITPADWLERYKRRFMEIAGLEETQAQACAEAESFAVLSEGFEDDPEGAADEEMSYWDGD